MKRTFTIEQLAAGIPRRLPGYFEECQRRGQYDPVKKTLTFTERDFQEIRQQYNLNAGVLLLKPGCCGK